MKTLFKLVARPVQVGIRSQQIAYVLSRYGLAGNLTALGIEVGRRGLSYVGASGAPVRFDAVFGRNLAKTCAKLGPTFIKLGQMLASRPDFVGEPVAEELKILLDRVPGISFREVQKILQRELGKKKAKEGFKSIEPKALASASLSQTHRAELADGTPVILKVQKKNVDEIVKNDLIILEGLVRPLDLVYPRAGLLQVFKDFKEATLREIDYREEAKNIDRFQKNYFKLFSGKDILFPHYYPDLTTQRVIVLEPMQGKQVHQLRKGSTVARHVASMSLAAVLEQIFDHGFFHADPHAGNLFFLEDSGQLGFIDLGLVGQLEPSDKRKFLKVLMAILQRDKDRLAKTLWDLGVAGKKAKFDKFEADVQTMLDEVKAQGVDNLRMETLINKLLSVARRNALSIPNRYVLMIRSCLLIEGVAKSLDPSISIFKVATPIVAKSLMKSYNPFSVFKRWL